MSLALIQSLAIDGIPHVCRFCLQSNETQLRNLYETQNTSIISISTSIRNVLNQLGIQIAEDDPYPNWICSSCRSLLFSIEKFKETVRESLVSLDKARLLREVPAVKFEDVRQMPVEAIHEELIVEEHDIGDESEQVEKTPEPEAELPEEGIYLGESEPCLKEEVESLPESEYAETEWILYDEEQDEEDDSVVERSDVDQEDEEDTATIYLDEEVERESVLEAEPNPVKKTTPSNVCPICGKVSTAMSVHMRTHTNTRPFACEACPKAFYTRNKLRVHVESVHQGQRPFQCEICSKAFALKKTLNAHMQSHLSRADMEFRCQRCPKKFPFRWALAKHERVHTGERPFVCTLDGCGKSFASSSNLRQHQKTNVHWKEPREDACGDCGAIFKTKYALRAHRKAFHANGAVKAE